MSKDKKVEIAKGVGMALGVVTRIAIQLFVLWAGLWILANFGWLPF